MGHFYPCSDHFRLLGKEASSKVCAYRFPYYQRKSYHGTSLDFSIGIYFSKFNQAFPVLLKLFFDEEALDEGVILEWASEGRSEYTLVPEEVRADLRGLAEPVVIWLQDDDSDEDDE